MADQDAKGLLGRLICAYGPVNKELELSTCPSAEPARAFEVAASKKHHTVVYAIWGYTYVIPNCSGMSPQEGCHGVPSFRFVRMVKDALRASLPAPAPAEMQSYVHRTGGALRDLRKKEAFYTDLMDALPITCS